MSMTDLDTTEYDTFAELVGAEPPLAGGVSIASELRRQDRIKKQTWKRRASPIRAYIGPNGAGKSATAIRDLLPSIDKGRPILSTVPILDPSTGDLYRNYIPFTGWEYILDDSFKHADVLMDEVTGIANSRDAMGLPRQVQTVLDKLRKRDLTLSWTAPAWGRADTTIRSCTIAVNLCKGYVSAPDTNNDTSGEIAAWRPKRLFRVRSFSAVDFEEFTVDRASQGAQKNRRLRAETVEWWWGPNSRVFRAYNTMDAVSRVGAVLDSGRCAHCGGSRPAVKCSCDNHAHTVK
jgi:hypothetical protein